MSHLDEEHWVRPVIDLACMRGKTSFRRRKPQRDSGLQRYVSNPRSGRYRLAPAVADIEPAGAIALAAPFLILVSRSQASGAGFPICLVERTSIHAGTALARSDLRTLAID
jgi:hypothetical protein